MDPTVQLVDLPAMNTNVRHVSTGVGMVLSVLTASQLTFLSVRIVLAGLGVLQIVNALSTVAISPLRSNAGLARIGSGTQILVNVSITVFWLIIRLVLLA